MAGEHVIKYTLKFTIELEAEIQDDEWKTRSGNPYTYRDQAAYFEKEIEIDDPATIRKASVELLIMDDPFSKILNDTKEFLEELAISSDVPEDE